MIEQGQIVPWCLIPPAFDEVIANIKKDEGVVWVRETWFWLEPCLRSRTRGADIGTYERMCGIHLSLGAKHGTYAKPHIKRGEGKYHVDVFAITESVMLGEHCVFRDGARVNKDEEMTRQSLVMRRSFVDRACRWLAEIATSRSREASAEQSFQAHQSSLLLVNLSV